MVLKYETLFEYVSIGSLSAVYCGIGSVILYLISSVEPSPYIDEIFHANQSLAYCQGNFFEYHPKITTPPGLYAATVAILLPLSGLTHSNLCTLNAFRLVNFIFSQLLFILTYGIIRFQVNRSSRASKSFMVALNLCVFPILYFYSFFYYTDVLSTFLVLLTYRLYKASASHSAGFAGLLSVTVRQTNLVWFCCFAFIRCCRCVENEARKAGRLSPKTEKQRLLYILIILRESYHLARHSFRRFVLLVLRETYLFVLSSLVFLYLIVVNGSLVLGHKSAHRAVVHLPQLLYFSLFTSVFAFPLCVGPCLKLLRNSNRLKLKLTLSALVLAAVVATNTMAHLFLISDNRHYTFYIWKRIFEKPVGKFVPIPLYVASVYCIVENTRHLDSCTKIAYFLATALCLVPQKLLEFRYFIVPYLLYRLETWHKMSRWQLLLEFAFSVLVNYLSIGLFLRRSFQWPDGSVQRFSW